jgi:hypothetical protein
MSSQTSMNNGDMVVADIINEIHSNTAQPPHTQQQRGTPMPQQMQNPSQQQRATPMPQQMQSQPQQQRGTPMPQQMQNPSQPHHGTPVNRGTPVQTDKSKDRDNENFMNRQKERMQEKKTKKVRFNDVVEEFGGEDDEDETDSTEVIMKRPTKAKSAPKFLTSDDVNSNDLKETKGLYSSVMGFFTKDTKEPLVVIALVFAISLPIVSKLMTKFLPFLMKNGNDSFLVLGFKAFLVGIMFFTMKKLLL